MKVNSITNYNANFKGKEKKTKEKGQYFKWISQNQANRALFMTKGREVKNGKFALADSMLKLGTIASGFAAAFLLLKGKQKAGLGALIGSTVALMGSQIVESINIGSAVKTSKERGFTLGSVNMQPMPRSFAKAYSETEEVYNKNVVQG